MGTCETNSSKRLYDFVNIVYFNALKSLKAMTNPYHPPQARLQEAKAKFVRLKLIDVVKLFFIGALISYALTMIVIPATVIMYENFNFNRISFGRMFSTLSWGIPVFSVPFTLIFTAYLYVIHSLFPSGFHRVSIIHWALVAPAIVYLLAVIVGIMLGENFQMKRLSVYAIVFGVPALFNGIVFYSLWSIRINRLKNGAKVA